VDEYESELEPLAEQTHDLETSALDEMVRAGLAAKGDTPPADEA
jgi:hypothetical protein